MSREESERLAFVRFVERTCAHIHGVQRAAVRLARSGPMPDPVAKDLLLSVVHHDRSKFSAEEMNAYFRYWNLLTDAERGLPAERAAFERAWTHHKARNQHHPEHWPSPDVMPPHAVLEMVCDWASMSEEKGTSLAAWARWAVPEKGLRAHAELIRAAVDELSR